MLAEHKQAGKSRHKRPLKPVSPEINGVIHPRTRIPGRELECVLTAINDAMAILDAVRRDPNADFDLEELTQAITVLDAAWYILENEISNR